MQTIMQIRLRFLIGFCFLLMALPGRAQTFKFQTTETNVLKTATQLQTHGFPDTMTVRNYNWFYTTANPATWGNYVKFKSNHAIVKFSVNQAYPKKVYTAYGYQLIFQVSGYANPADTTQATTFNDTLTIHYNPDSLSAYQDIQIKKYSGYHKVRVILNDILDITDPNAIVSVNLATINLNFNIEAMKLTQMYDKTYYGYNNVLTAEYTTPAVANDLLDVKWCVDAGCSPARVTPCSYELEWTYIDDFAADGGNIDDNDLSYDFRNNSTRIWLDTNYFQIPITYARGYIAYRVRMVRPDSVEFRYPMYSKWTETDDAGVLSSMNADHYYQITNSHLSDSLNWQYTISFAEQGKYKHVLSYFDGLLKNRQSITRFNSQANKLIATSSIFDFEGRPAIQVLPTPVNSPKFKYQYGMTTNELTDLPYRAGNFDSLYGYACPVEPLIPPLDSLALPNLYYSGLNADTANFQKFVPHAEQYPMVHTKFEPGYADRVEKQGGAGLPLQLGNNHVLHNDYLNGEQTDLNILFGVNAGYEGFYNKTVSRDPNGQLSMMISDYEGKQVASTLIGNGPGQVEHAIEDMDSIISPSYYSYDLIGNTPQQVTGNKIILDKMYYMDVAGTDTVRYQYKFTPYNTGCDSLYLSVKASYEYYVADKCGVKQLERSDVLGTTGLVFSGASTTFPEDVGIVDLEQGKQFLHKELVFNSDDVYAAVDSFMVFPDNCLHDEPWFIRNAVLEREFPCPIDSLAPCEQLKYKMMQELYPGAKYGKYFINPNDIVVDTTNNSIFSNLCDTVVSHNLNYYTGGDTTYVFGSNSMGAWQDVDTTFGEGAGGENGGALGVGGVDTVFLFGNYAVGYYGYGTGVGGGFGNDTSANCYNYRYQDTCLVHLPDSVVKNGIVYHNIWSVSADTFIFIFNDEIAEALLPLHPEYCKLNNCITDTFKEKYLDVPDFATAQKFDFDFLGSITDQDPLVPILTAAPFNFPDAEDSLATFGGVLHLRLDTFVMKQVYCGCSDTTMAKKCIDQQFNHEIFNNILVNDYLKSQYFTKLRELYLQNRARYITMVTGYGSDSTCGPCNLVRMKLIPSPIFPNGITNNGGINPNLLDSLSPGMQNIVNNANDMDATDIANAQDSAKWYVNYVDTLLCYGQIDSIIQRLSNCNNANPTTLNDIRSYLEDLCANNLVSNGNYSPDQIHAAIESSGATLDEYCNPYMVNYDVFNPMFANAYQQCKGTDFYTDVKDFLNDAAITASLFGATGNPSSATNITLNNSSQFESRIKDLLNTVNATAIGYYNAVENLYTICLYEQSPGASQMDTVKVYLKNPMNGAGPCTGLFNSLPGGSTITFNTVVCTSIMFPGSGSIGYINSFSFGTEAAVYNATTTLTTQCKLIGWSDSVETMKPNSGAMADCVPCTQMRELFDQFNDTLAVYGILGTDHPCYGQMLRSFMNGRLSKIFATDDYLRFIGSCALADYNPFKNYLAYSSISFSGGNYVNSFLSGLNAIDPDIYLYPFLQYKSGASDTTLLFDYSGVPLSKLHMVRSYFSSFAYGTKLHNTLYNPPATATYMGILLKSTADTSTINATVIPCTFTYSSPQTVQVFNGMGYSPYYLYYVSIPASPTPEDINTEIGKLEDFIYDYDKSFLFYPSHMTTIGGDYYQTEKQDFLAYIYQSQGLEVPVVLDTIREQLLPTEIASYSGKNVSYKLPFSPFTPEHLYITDGSSTNAMFTQKLENMFDTLADFNAVAGYESPFYFDIGSPQDREVTMAGGRKLNAYLCGDGSYWIRYFGAGDTLYNFYMRMPKYITRSDHKYYKVTDVALLPGNNTSRYFSVSLENVNDATKNLSIQGIADYEIGSTLVLEDVLLSNSMASKEVPVIDTFDNCERQKLLSAIYEGKVKYKLYIDSVRAALYVALLGHLTNSAEEKMSHGYKDQRFLFTLYYYDRASNLMRTVPPEGLNKLEFSQTMMDDVDNARGSKTSPTGTLPGHEKISYYDYNSINKIVRQQSPDGGETRFFYDVLGRLIFSQNDKQKTKGYYTYTLYDKQSRIIETGQSKLGCTYFEPYPYTYVDTLGFTVVATAPANNSCYYIDNNANLYVPYPPLLFNYTGLAHEDIIAAIRATNRTDVVFTVYDTIAKDLTLVDGLSEQTNLRKRVACVKFFESIHAADTGFLNYTHATHYSYDIAGNVNYLVQDFPYFDYLSQRYKRVDYDYDVISGKVNLVSYNRSFADQYYHRYTYDSDNRITKVETSSDAYLWKQDASYQYYQHGPLARAEIGDLRVQGIDFAYTIQGWLKAINGDTLAGGMDMGEDGNMTSIFPRDPAGLVLDYFVDDYKGISGRKVAAAKPQSKSLYNGNIARQTTAMQPFMTLCKQYVYDQLNRIKRTDYANVNVTEDTLFQTDEYRNTYNYDDDGNLLKLTRMGNKLGTSSPVMMDTFTYFYYTGNNQLRNVTDLAADNYSNDIKYYTSGTANRFVYDATGNITKDLVSHQDTIHWNLYNKVTHTENNTDTTELDFVYDGAGNRVAKHYTKHSDTDFVKTTDYYVRDAQGNILAVYNDKQRIEQVSIEAAVLGANALLTDNLGTTDYLGDFVTNAFAADPDFTNFMVNNLSNNESLYASYLNYDPSYYMLRNNTIVQNMILGGHKYIRPLALWDTLQISNVLKAMYANNNTVLQNQLMVALYQSPKDTLEYLLGKMNDTLLTEICSQLAIDTSSDTLALLTNRIGEVATSVNLAYGSYPYSINLWMHALARDSVFTTYSGFVPLIQNTLYAYRDDTTLADFFDYWSGLSSGIGYYNSSVSKPDRFMTVFKDSTYEVLAKIYNEQDMPVIDSAIAATKTAKNFQKYLKLMINGVNLSVQDYLSAMVSPYWYAEVITSEHYNLAEHHLYGSSRLGIKGYWPNQLYSLQDYSDTSAIIIDTALLAGRQPWYSEQYQDGIKPDALQPWNSTFTNTARMQTILGQKQYEQTDHLGNVVITSSDRKYALADISDSLITGYHAELPSTYDYYPFGMLMPGRYTSDTSTQCATVSHTVMVPTLVTYNDPLTAAAPYNISATALSNITATTLDVSTIGANKGFSLPLSNVELLKDNELEFEVYAINKGQFYIAEIYEYNLTDTILLTSEVVDRNAVYNISFLPNGSGNVGLILKTTNAPGTTASLLKVKNFNTTVITYTAQSISSVICNNGGDRYRFGFNGQEKTNEIAGIGNHNTALFWEYDTRLARRWNLDPVDQIWISNYACFGNSPNIMIDVLGDQKKDYESKNVSEHKSKQKTYNSTRYGIITNLTELITGKGKKENGRDGNNASGSDDGQSRGNSQPAMGNQPGSSGVPGQEYSNRKRDKLEDDFGVQVLETNKKLQLSAALAGEIPAPKWLLQKLGGEYARKITIGSKNSSVASYLIRVSNLNKLVGFNAGAKFWGTVFARNFTGFMGRSSIVLQVASNGYIYYRIIKDKPSFEEVQEVYNTPFNPGFWLYKKIEPILIDIGK